MKPKKLVGLAILVMVISMLLNQTVFASSAVNSVTFEQARKI